MPLNIELEGKILFINAFNCDALPKIDNLEELLLEDKNNDPLYDKE